MGATERTMTLPVEGQAIHVHLSLVNHSERLILRSIEFRPAKGTPDLSDFSTAAR